jgi:hypothetical protein
MKDVFILSKSGIKPSYMIYLRKFYSDPSYFRLVFDKSSKSQKLRIYIRFYFIVY